MSTRTNEKRLGLADVDAEELVNRRSVHGEGLYRRY
jgi:hypothetical protein